MLTHVPARESSVVLRAQLVWSITHTRAAALRVGRSGTRERSSWRNQGTSMRLPGSRGGQGSQRRDWHGEAMLEHGLAAGFPYAVLESLAPISSALPAAHGSGGQATHPDSLGRSCRLAVAPASHASALRCPPASLEFLQSRHATQPLAPAGRQAGRQADEKMLKNGYGCSTSQEVVGSIPYIEFSRSLG
jgi:hypothetical protein